MLSWIEGKDWIRDTFRGKQQMLCDSQDYQLYAKRLGYEGLDLSKIPAIRVMLATGMNTLGSWMRSHPEYIPENWHEHGFTESDEISCYASIHHQRIKAWCETNLEELSIKNL